jgi:NAD(P)-dependent dehydrogenase (short-subunit alcohol dehydrogenase family)
VLELSDHGAIDNVIKGFPRIDVLVNCAGTNRRYGQEFEAETFDMVVDINLSGTMRACYAALPQLKASPDACILNIASMFSLFGSPSIPGYASSKAAVVALTRSLALAWAEHEIRVNAIAPGFIATKLTRDVVENAERTRQIKDRTPMGRWVEPADLAGPASFLCSRDAAFVTGALLTVDGGYSVA